MVRERSELSTVRFRLAALRLLAKNETTATRPSLDRAPAMSR
jgi:hypothetical protein